MPASISIVGRFRPFHRPRRPLGRVEVEHYSFRPRHKKGVRDPRHATAVFYPRERPATHCTGGWVGSRAGMDVCGNPAPIGIRSPDRSARSQSLYRLSYPAHISVVSSKKEGNARTKIALRRVRVTTLIVEK
jgi:hypothetical protein